MKKLIAAALALGMAGTAACSATTPRPVARAGHVKPDPAALETAKKDTGNILNEVTAAR
jgi:hypothetical protein